MENLNSNNFYNETLKQKFSKSNNKNQITTDNKMKKFYLKSSSYQLLNYLGKGGYAVVVECRRLIEEQQQSELETTRSTNVAIKIVRKTKKPGVSLKQLIFYTKREVSIMKQLNHENIVKLWSYHQDRCFIYLILELCENKSLSSLVNNNRVMLPNVVIRKFVYDITKGCHYLHQNLIVHRDLKMDNILLSRDLSAKIADFGLAITLSHSEQLLQTICGTLKYQAPEMISGSGYNFSVDVWALGCITYRMFYGNTPFDGKGSDEILKATLNRPVKYSRLSKYNNQINNNEIKLMKCLLMKQPAKRTKMSQMLTNKKLFQQFMKSDDSIMKLSSGTSPMATTNYSQIINEKKVFSWEKTDNNNSNILISNNVGDYDNVDNEGNTYPNKRIRKI